MAPTMKFAKLHKDAIKPTRSTPKSAGLDLKSYKASTIKSKAMGVINTGIAVCIPDGCYGRIAARSRPALRNRILIGAGVVDADYTGPLKILVHNFSSEDVKIEAGESVAQLICEKIEYPELEEVDELEETERGSRGLGAKNNE